MLTTICPTASTPLKLSREERPTSRRVSAKGPGVRICLPPPPSLANCGTAETVRFSARLARRAERASFSAFVSNPDFRVPRLRQIGWRAADRAVRRRKRGHPRGPESRPGYRGVAGLARSGPGAARASLMSIFPQAWIQAFARERGIPFLDGVSLPRTGEPESPAATSPSKGHWCHLVRISEDLHDRLGSTLASRTNRPDIRKQSHERASPRS